MVGPRLSQGRSENFQNKDGLRSEDNVRYNNFVLCKNSQQKNMLVDDIVTVMLREKISDLARAGGAVTLT